MTFRNGVHDESQQLRDIQELIAKLEDVNRLLALPVRAMPAAPATVTEATPQETPGV